MSCTAWNTSLVYGLTILVLEQRVHWDFHDQILILHKTPFYWSYVYNKVS